MALSAIIFYYHLLKRTLKALIKKHIADMRKSNCKQREKALALLAQRKPCATRALAKARTKIKMTQVGNIFLAKTARLLEISRPTVLKWLKRFFQKGEAGLENHSSRPHTSVNKTPDQIEQLVLEIFAKTNYGFRRIAKVLKRRYGIKISYGTVRNILRRHNKYKPRIKIAIRRTGRRYYNPLDFKPFEFFQIDIKEVIDGDTLPEEVYTHFLELARQNVPLYQFTAIDVRTRVRFIAYGQQKSFSHGWAFILLVVLWRLCRN